MIALLTFSAGRGGGAHPDPGWVFVFANGLQVFANGFAVAVPLSYANS